MNLRSRLLRGQVDSDSVVPADAPLKVEDCKKLRRSISNRTELRRAVAAATLDARVRCGTSWDFWYRYGDSNPGPVAENHVS